MFDEELGKEPRDFTVEERCRKFLAYKAKQAAHPIGTGDKIVWHEIDDEMTPEQDNELPRAVNGSRTPLLWVRYRHLRLRQIVVAKGYFDYEDRRWIARYEPQNEGNVVAQVEPLAWASIIPGVRPWSGPIIPKRTSEAQ